jgi:hypothetical protein
VIDPSVWDVVYTAGDQSQYLVLENRSATCDFSRHFVNGVTEIRGSTCDIVRADPGAELSVVVPCVGPTT